MHRSLLVVLLAIFVSAPLAAKLPSRPESIKPLYAGDQAICTTWSLHQKLGLWMTAAHCVVRMEEVDGAELLIPIVGLQITGKPVTTGRVDVQNDLAVMQADVHEPALSLGPYPDVGDEVTVYGYPGGWKIPLATWLRVSNPFMMEWGRGWMILDGSVWPGHSGSPVLDRKGRVIGVLQAHDTERYTGMTFASHWGTFRAFVANALPS